MTKPIAIIGALKAEIDGIIRHLENSKQTKWKGFVFYEGILCGKDVVMVKSGVGKVFAALATQKLIDSYSPSSIIFTGVAGGINKDYKIGDVVVAKDCVQHDLDVSEMGFSRGTVPYTDFRFFETDEKLRKLGLSAKIEHTIHKGRILTGDQFLTKKALTRYKYLIDELEGDAIEMEGAAVGQVCTINDVPFLIIRTISDKANNNASVDFAKFLPEIANNSFNMVKHILQNL